MIDEKYTGCKWCASDDLSDLVAYIPNNDTGGADDMPVNFCPNCGRSLILVEGKPTVYAVVHHMGIELFAEWLRDEGRTICRKAMDYAWKYRKTGNLSAYWKQGIIKFLNEKYKGNSRVD